jgi:Uncharacterized conserved protein (DUF2358)
MDLLELLKADYARFPKNQTYSLYAEDVRFKDPMNEFTGINRYRQMIGFLSRFFSDIQMDLHEIQQVNSTLITMQWTLNMTAPLPWSPRLSIPGRSELGLNSAGLIDSHVDYWARSRFKIFSQLFSQPT